MKVILKQDIESLGRKGDIVDVARGYGRNYLIPRKMAIEVTSSNMNMIQREQQVLKKAVEKERASSQELIQRFNQLTLTFKRKTAEKDLIFGSVSASDIKEALQELGYEVDKKKILLDDHIKRLGNYSVPIKIFHEEQAELKVEVVKEEEEQEAKEKKEALKKKKKAAEEMEEPEEKSGEAEETEQAREAESEEMPPEVPLAGAENETHAPEEAEKEEE